MASSSDRIAMMVAVGRIARDAIARAAPTNRFGRLKDSFRFIANGRTVTVYSIYYWARFVNDGRKAINLRDGRVMMFFKDPELDPRISDDYPRSRAARKRLTKQEAREAKASGELVVTTSVGPVGPLRFIETGIREARDLIPREVRNLIKGDIRKFVRRRRDSITVRL